MIQNGHSNQGASCLPRDPPLSHEPMNGLLPVLLIPEKRNFEMVDGEIQTDFLLDQFSEKASERIALPFRKIDH
jgi:hypothetical protein